MHETQKQLWLDEALALIPDETIRSEAAAYLTPLLKKCHSNSRKTFWQWLRLTLARTQETAIFLSWMQESKLRLPVEKMKDGFQYVLSDDGSTALIDVSNESGDHAVWRVPVSYLDWALSLYPISLKRLPDLESHNAAEIRRMKRKIAREMPFLTPAQRGEFERCIAELEDEDRRAYTPAPRYMLVKYENGQEQYVHKLYTRCGEHEVEAVNGDYLDFGTTRLRLTMQPLNCGWIRPIENCSTEIVVQNLQIVNNKKLQDDFEDSLLPTKLTPQGDVDETPLQVRPNFNASNEGGHSDDETVEDSYIETETDDTDTATDDTGDETKDSPEIIPTDPQIETEVAQMRFRWRVPSRRDCRWRT